jgi:hypothetical protein
MSPRPLASRRGQRAQRSAWGAEILTLTLLLTGVLATRFAAAGEWPDPTWGAATPASQWMDAAQLQKARDFALRGGVTGEAPAVSDTGNAAPIVNAGPDVTVVLPQDTITLAGSVSDDGQPGGALTMKWEDASRAGAVFSSAADPESLVTFPAAGIYVLELSANDGETWTHASMTVTVVDPAAPPTKLAVMAQASTQARQADGAPLRTTWLGFSLPGPSDGALATLRIHIGKVLTPGRIEVHRVLGAWDAQTVNTPSRPPIDPIPIAAYTVERADSDLALETDVSAAVSSWTSADAARGLALVGVSGDVVIAGGSAESNPEIRLDR